MDNMTQLSITFPPQNSPANQAILDCNRARYSRQCRLVLTMLESGCSLTTTTALTLGIGDLRARIRDLIKAGIPVQKRLIEGGYKEYYL